MVMVGIICSDSTLRGRAREVQVSATVGRCRAASRRRHDGSASVCGIGGRHGADGAAAGDGGHQRRTLRRADSSASARIAGLWTLLPRMEAFTDGGVCEWRRRLAGQLVTLRCQHR